MKKPTCDTCVYWDKYKDMEFHQYGQGNGICRRRQKKIWCATYDTDGCGEHHMFGRYLESVLEEALDKDVLDCVDELNKACDAIYEKHHKVRDSIFGNKK